MLQDENSERFLSYDNREREAFYDGNICKQERLFFIMNISPLELILHVLQL